MRKTPADQVGLSARYTGKHKYSAPVYTEETALGCYMLGRRAKSQTEKNRLQAKCNVLRAAQIESRGW